MSSTTYPFSPDWVSPPGDTIADLLEEYGWTQVELGERLGYDIGFVNQLVNGDIPIDEGIALKLEQVLGSTKAFWLRREAEYRAALCKGVSNESIT